MTKTEDAIVAAELGVDAIGLIFVPSSSRLVTLPKALTIVQALPAWVSTVVVVANQSAEEIKNLITALPFDMLQFHGDETPEFCQQFNKPYIKVIRMREGVNVSRMIEQYHTANGFLLDSYHADRLGGTGNTFDWKTVPSSQVSRPIILAGGLTPENVGQAITQVQPYGVDVVSGIESMSGCKDQTKMRQFITEVNNADRT
jgi:phosphoribosylanthranilate isomerase